MDMHTKMEALQDLKAAMSGKDYESLQTDPLLDEKIEAYLCLQLFAKTRPEYNLNIIGAMQSLHSPSVEEMYGYDFPNEVLVMDSHRLFDWKGKNRGSIELFLLPPRGSAFQYYDIKEWTLETMGYFDPTDDHWTNPMDKQSEDGKGWSEVYESYTKDARTSMS